MSNISSEAKVKLETLAPQVARLLQREFAPLRSPQTRARLEAEGKVKPIPGLENTYRFQVSPHYELILQSGRGGFTKGGRPFLSDIINISRLEKAMVKAKPAPVTAMDGANDAKASTE